MEVKDVNRTKWSLKKIDTSWYLDVSGKLKALKFLNDSTQVTLKENVISADENQYQLIDNNGEITIEEIESIEVCTSKHDRTNTNSKELNAKSKEESKVALRSPKNIHRNKIQGRPNENRNSKLVDCADVYDEDKYVYYNEGKREDNVKGEDVYDEDKYVYYNEGKREDNVKGEDVYDEDKYVYYNEGKREDNVKGEDVYDEDKYVYYNEGKREDNVKGEAVPESKSVTAWFDFERYSDDEISFKKLDKLKICENISSDNAEWCYAQHLSSCKKGYIPVAFVTQSKKDLLSQDWWHDINRSDAEDLFTQCENAMAGTFLIRPSGKGKFALSMLVPKSDNQGLRIAHYLIKSEGDEVFISNTSKFSDIVAFVDNHKSKADGLPCVFSGTVPKQCPFVYPRRTEIERNSIELFVSYDVGKFRGLFTGRLSGTFDVTIVTNCRRQTYPMLADVQNLCEFRKSEHFVRFVAEVSNSDPGMIVLGETIKETLHNHLRIDFGKTIKFSDLTNMASEIAFGMAYLEEKGIVHGNLKADNVFVCDQNKVKIMHSQLIKLMEDTDNDQDDWQWKAPEVTADENALSTKSDVWSFGVLLYEMISFGEIPYTGFEKDEVFRGLSNGLRLQKPKDGPFECPVEFYHTMLQCWHKIPESRLTFDFLGGFLDSYETAIQDYQKIDQHQFKTGTLQRKKKATADRNSLKMLPNSHIIKDDCESETDDDIICQNTVYQNQSLQNDNESEAGFTSTIKVIALYSFTAVDDGDISFEKGDIITNIEQIDEGWWEGTTKNGERGILPANYVKICEDI